MSSPNGKRSKHKRTSIGKSRYTKLNSKKNSTKKKSRGQGRRR